MEIEEKFLLFGQKTGIAGPANKFTIETDDLLVMIEHNEGNRSMHMDYSRQLSEEELLFFKYLSYVLTGDRGLLPDED